MCLRQSRSGFTAAATLSGLFVAWAIPAAAWEERVVSVQAAVKDSGTGDRRTRAETDSADSTAPSDRSAWTVEPFVRGGLTGLLVDGDVVLASRLDDADSWPSQYRGISAQLRSSHWGGGVRAMRGRWGLEATWQRLGAADLIGAVVLESEIARTRAGRVSAPLREVPAQVVGVLALTEFGLPGGDADAFVGFGVGHVRVAERSLPSEALSPRVSPAATFSLREDGEEFRVDGATAALEVAGDRGSFLVVGSAGLTLARGRLLLRPRLDVFVAQAMSEVESWDVYLRYADEERFRLTGGETLETLVRSSAFLFSLDVGWSFAR